MTAGLISLGQGGFMAIGAYVSAVLTKEGVPFSLAVAAGGLLASLSGIVVGIPAIRIRGIYLIIITLGFGEIVRVFFLNFSYTGGASGRGGMAPYTDLAPGWRPPAWSRAWCHGGFATRALAAP